MLKKYVECGKIVSTHGVRGELKVQPWADNPEDLYKFEDFYLNQGKTKLESEAIRVHKNMVLLKVKNINDLDSARELRGQTLYINREDDPDDTPYLQDYVGISVIDVDTGEIYGKITSVMETGANNVYILKDDKGTERLVPVIPQVVISSDLKQREIKIRPLEGLFDDED